MRKPQLTKPIITFRTPLLSVPFARWCTIAAATLLTAAWVVILGIPNLPGPDALIVHYTTTFGIDALGNWRDLLRLPLTGTVLLAVNLAIARLLQPEAESQKSRRFGRDPDTQSLGPEVRADGTNEQVRAAAALSPTSLILVVANIPLQFVVLLGSMLLWRANT